MNVNAISEHFAAEVSGIDLREPVDGATRAELNRLWGRYAVLVFRDQPLTPPQYGQAVQIFGELMQQNSTKYTLPDHPLIGFNSTNDLPRKADGSLRVRGENYHTDHSNWPAPPKATSLVAVQLPSRGGDTQFVDVRAAYDDLSDELKARIARLRSRHVHESSRSPRMMAKLSAEQQAKSMLQPLVIRHPESGRLALYLNTARMEGIEALAPDEGFDLINALYDHATQAKYEYRHSWRLGDMVIWDNRSVMHQANADYDPAEQRFMYRAMLKGTPLVAAFS